MPDGSFPDALILAALARAELHNGRDEAGVLYSSIVDHLGLKMGSSTGHKLRPRIRAMEAAGLIRGFKRLGMIAYAPTPKGDRVLREAGAQAAIVLPESPQHRQWREGRAAAVERIDSFRDDLRAILSEGVALLADEATDSEAWAVFGEKTGKACKRLGSATYCLREWAEPSDASADIDDSRRLGRRNPRSWD
jgi:hypothetical protein